MVFQNKSTRKRSARTLPLNDFPGNFSEDVSDYPYVQFRKRLFRCQKVAHDPELVGRKARRNQRRQVRIPAKTIEKGLLPLDYMLAMMRDDQIEPLRRDQMAIQCAPYIHPRLGAVLQASIPGRDIVEEAAAAVNIVSIPRGGRIDPKTGVVTAPEIVPIEPYRVDPAARAERSARAEACPGAVAGH